MYFRQPLQRRLHNARNPLQFGTVVAAVAAVGYRDGGGPEKREIEGKRKDKVRAR